MKLKITMTVYDPETKQTQSYERIVEITGQGDITDALSILFDKVRQEHPSIPLWGRHIRIDQA